MANAKLSPSILTADFSNIGEIFRMFERHPSVGYIHFDVMDGNFVPNVSFGAPVIRSLAGKTRLPFDVHLMIKDPERFVEDYISENTEYIVIHAEATLHLDRVLRQIKSTGAKPGVALNPATPPEAIEHVLHALDQVLVMSVNPGFGGQAFIPSALEKLRRIAALRAKKGLDFKIAVDGGVGRDNILEVTSAGADMVIAGSAILSADDPDEELCAFDEMLKGEEV